MEKNFFRTSVVSYFWEISNLSNPDELSTLPPPPESYNGLESIGRGVNEAAASQDFVASGENRAVSGHNKLISGSSTARD